MLLGIIQKTQSDSGFSWDETIGRTEDGYKIQIWRCLHVSDDSSIWDRGQARVRGLETMENQIYQLHVFRMNCHTWTFTAFWVIIFVIDKYKFYKLIFWYLWKFKPLAYVERGNYWQGNRQQWKTLSNDLSICLKRTFKGQCVLAQLCSILLYCGSVLQNIWQSVEEMTCSN